jgi:vacuolar-type H+-ATPase subunit F/Vma7
MSVLVVGSREVVAAFALGGWRGRAVGGRAEALAVLEEAAGGGEVKLLVVEEAVAERVREAIDRLKLDVRAPLVVEVPGFGGPAEERKTPLELVRQALGIRV